MGGLRFGLGGLGFRAQEGFFVGALCFQGLHGGSIAYCGVSVRCDGVLKSFIARIPESMAEASKGFV